MGFPKQNDAISIRNVLQQHGFSVSAPCTLGSQIITMINNLDEGIVVCGYRFTDLHYSELNNYLPKGFEMLLLASPEKLEYAQDNNIVCLPMPVKTQDLVNTLNMMIYEYHRRKKKDKDKRKIKTEEEKAFIQRAKEVLIVRHHMSEEEAHRYLQKYSMDCGMNLKEVAEMVINMVIP